MVLRCAWGTCNADERYPDRMNGARLILFPKPKTNLEKCLRWIKACGRPHDQLNVGRINKHKAVCSTHFIGGSGPTNLNPDPLPADGSKSTPSRPLPKRRLLNTDLYVKKKKTMPFHENTELLNCESVNDMASTANSTKVHVMTDSATQTEEKWISPMDLLSVVTELHTVKGVVKKQEERIKELEEAQNAEKHKAFGVKEILLKENVKDLFKYYTGLVHLRFVALLSFLVPPGFEMPYEKGRHDIYLLSNEDALFLTLCRLRHNFGLKDVAVRFGLSIQSAGVVFNTWIDHIVGWLTKPRKSKICFLQGEEKTFYKPNATVFLT